MRHRPLFVALIGALIVTAAVFLLRRPREPEPVPPDAPSATLPSGAPAPPSMTPIELIEQRLVDLTNDARARSGLALLEPDAMLALAARHHSEDMLRRGFFDHVNPDRQSPAERTMRPAGDIGENIWGWSGSTTPDLPALAPVAFAEWLASAAHRDNILRADYTHVGVGVAANTSDVRATQLFSR